MADEQAPLSDGMRQVLQERETARRRKEVAVRKANKRDQHLAAGIRRRPNQNQYGNYSAAEQVVRLTHQTRKTYLAMLCEPEVVAAFRQGLLEGKARDLRDILTAIRELIQADTGIQSGGTKVTLAMHVPRPPGQTAIDVTPPEDP